MIPAQAIDLVRSVLGPERLTSDRKRRRPQNATPSWGCCYIASEAVREILGRDLYTPHSVKVTGDVHWYLVHKETGAIVDPTADQFDTAPDYASGRGRGFLTKEPSKRARAILEDAWAAMDVSDRFDLMEAQQETYEERLNDYRYENESVNS